MDDNKQLSTPLNKAVIKQRIAACMRPSLAFIEHFECIDSTNTYLLSQSCPRCGWVCLADSQTKGRGRFGRTWYSPKSAGLYLSMLWELPAWALSTPLTLMVGVATVQAIQQYHRQAALPNIQLKWPNDIVWQGQKLGGILIESNSRSPQWVVIGIGINGTLGKLPEGAITQAYTDMASIIQSPIDRNKLASLLLTELLTLLTHVSRSSTSIKRWQAHYLEQWAALDALKGKTVKLTINNKKVNGIADGITHQGELTVRQADNTTITIDAGEVTDFTFHHSPAIL